MLFSGIPFLYYYLTMVLGLYFLVPVRWKNGVLLLSSLVFYAWGEPRYGLLMAGTIVLYYGYGRGIGCTRWKRGFLVLSVVTGVLLLAVFKYADFFIGSINAVTGLGIPLLRLTLPIGISFYTFQCVSYTVDVYRGQTPAQRNLIHFGAYVAMFPQLIAGPIVRYVDVARALEHRTHSWEGAALGGRRFLIGLGKKVLLANQLGLLTEVFRASGEKSVLFYWVYALAFTLHIYFDFSGYSDMAIGLGRIFGFRFPENFDYPYVSRSITEFWRRWHMTLGGWFRDYVYIPLGGNRVSRGRWVINILVVWMLTGLWHGAAWNFVLWGLLFALLLMLEKWLPIHRLPDWLRHGYVMGVVILSFVLFNGEDLRQVGQDLGGIFGLNGLPFVTAETWYYLKSYAVVLFVSVLGALPVARWLGKRCAGSSAAAVGEVLALAALLVTCTAYLVDGSFNPFLYFRF